MPRKTRATPPPATPPPKTPGPARGGAGPAASRFGIRAVAQMTDIDEHTLRVWERRYGFPHPLRSSGGARLYSSAEVHKLKLIRGALARGHRPGEIVAQDATALQALQGPVESSWSAATTAGAPAEVETLIAALVREDIDAIRGGLRQMSLLLGPRRFVVELAHPLAVRMGELWAAGKLEVHQEHLMSDCLSTQLRVLRSLFDGAHGPAVVLATLPGEPHGLGLEMIALYVAAGGLSPRVIGISTPPDQIARAARAHQAAAVGLAVMPSSDLQAAAVQIRGLTRELPRGTHLWIGGAGAAALPALDNAHVIASFADLDAAVLSLTTNPRVPGRDPTTPGR